MKLVEGSVGIRPAGAGRVQPVGPASASGSFQGDAAAWAWSRPCCRAARDGPEAWGGVETAGALTTPASAPRPLEEPLRLPAPLGPAATRHPRQAAVALGASATTALPVAPAIQLRQEPPPCQDPPSESEVHPPPPKSPTPPNSPPPTKVSSYKRRRRSRGEGWAPLEASCAFSPLWPGVAARRLSKKLSEEGCPSLPDLYPASRRLSISLSWSSTQSPGFRE